MHNADSASRSRDVGPSRNSSADADAMENAPIPSELIRIDPTYTDLVKQFLGGLSERLRAMERALQAVDFDTLRTAAHQLKGSGGGYGYPLLTDLAGQLERDALQRSLQDCIGSLARLKRPCSRLVVGG